MKKVLLIVINIIISGLIITGCNQPNEPSDEFEMQSYFPLKVGNWWIYEYFLLDENGNRTSKIQTDSVIVTGTDTINGKHCFILVEKCVDQWWSSTDTEYYYNEGARHYQLVNPWVGYKSQQDWYMMANLHSYGWDMFNIYDTLPHGGNPSYLHAVANISNNFETKVFFNSDSIICRNFSMKYKYTNRFLSLEGDTIENTISSYEKQYYYSKYIGLIKRIEMFYDGPSSFFDRGIEKMLIDYGPK